MKLPQDARAEVHRQARLCELSELGWGFFTKAKCYFMDVVISGIPKDGLRLQAGGLRPLPQGQPRTEVGAEMPENFEHGLRCADWSSEGPFAVTEPERSSPSWVDFKSWAAAHRLDPYWEMRHGEPEGTCLLCVKPAAQGLLA